MAKQASRKKQSRVESVESLEPIEPVTRLPENRLVVVAALLTLMLAMVVAFLAPRTSGDTFFTLAGGRDFFDGRLAQPDDWAFTTEGRVWINQAWGTGVVFYQLWKIAGLGGLLVFKATMIALMGWFLILASRRIGSSWTVAMLAAAFALAATHYFFMVRANMAGIAMQAALIWVLFWSAGHRHRIWLAVPLMTIWAEMHGSFIFGIGMMGWWAVVVAFVGYRAGWRGHQLTALWPLPVATLLAALLCVVASPFGLQNMLQPFSLMGLFVTEKWPLKVYEMLPLLGEGVDATFGGTLWYLFMLGCLIFAIMAVLLRRNAVVPELEKTDTVIDRRIKLVFISVLALITIVMTLRAQRFSVVSLIVCIPLLAWGFQQLLDRRQWIWITTLAIVGAAQIGEFVTQGTSWLIGDVSRSVDPAAVIDPRYVWGGVALVLGCLPLLLSLISGTRETRWRDYLEQHPRLDSCALLLPVVALFVILTVQLANFLPLYQRNHPAIPDYEFSERLLMLGLPDNGVQFLSDNQLEGRILSDWRWGGYLIWNNPRLKLMLDGRSRQVYPASAAIDYQQAYDSSDYTIQLKHNLGLMITPANSDYPLARRVLLDPNTPWRIIYLDGETLIAANSQIPSSLPLIDLAAGGQLQWPSEQSERVTRAAQQLAFSFSSSSDEEAIQVCQEATREHPVRILYELIWINMTANRILPLHVARFFESELDRLQEADYLRPQGIDVLDCRAYLASRLAELYSMINPPQTERATFWREYSQSAVTTANQYALFTENRSPVVVQFVSNLAGALLGGRAGSPSGETIPDKYLSR